MRNCLISKLNGRTEPVFGNGVSYKRPTPNSVLAGYYKVGPIRMNLNNTQIKLQYFENGNILIDGVKTISLPSIFLTLFMHAHFGIIKKQQFL